VLRRVVLVFILIVIMSLSSVPASLAQDRGLGVKGGVVLATQQITGATGTPSLTMRVAALAGAFYTLPLGSWLGVQVEGDYVMKGAKLDTLGIKTTEQIDYFEVPVLARVRLGGGNHHYYVAGGAAPAFRVRARASTDFSGSTEEIDIANQVERVDFGIAGGGGAVFGRWDVDARYTFGVRDIDADKTDALHTRNRALAFTAGFRF
jgi:hypothetical protein